jgi:hypothetical protein
MENHNQSLMQNIKMPFPEPAATTDEDNASKDIEEVEEDNVFLSVPPPLIRLTSVQDLLIILNEQ